MSKRKPPPPGPLYETLELDDTLTDEQKKKVRPSWSAPCENCGAAPIVPMTGLCGPCTFGEADTVAGGWWDDQKDEPTHE